MARLADKIAFITGIAAGQGRAAAVLFAREGATIVGCDLNAAGTEETVSMVRAAGGTIHAACPVHLSDRDAARRWIEDGVRAAGGIDILYNNAAHVHFDPFESVPLDNWNYALRNELDLVFHATQAAWPHLKARGGGSIINTASTSALRGNSRLGAAAHAAAKGGVIAMSRQLAAEGAAHRIRVNVISPGAIATPQTAWMADQAERVRAGIPLGRWGKPEDIAYCALYLAADESSWVTGSEFVIDGGITNNRQ